MHDYFAILGLAPGVYSQRELDARFAARRESLLQVLRRAAGAVDAGTALDDLHRAYQVLSDPSRQAAIREEILQRTWNSGMTPGETGEAALAHPAQRGARGDYGALRQLIADSLEDGLLRYSRRQQIIGAARELGLSDFETQLIIAQVQFGGIDVLLHRAAGTAVAPTGAEPSAALDPRNRGAKRGLAVAGALGLTMAAIAIMMLR